MILLSTLTAIVLLIAAAVICIYTYEHITRKNNHKKGENIMADNEETKTEEPKDEEQPKVEPKTEEQPKTEEPKKNDVDTTSAQDDTLEKSISEALKSIGRGKDDNTKEKEENISSHGVDIDDIVSRVVERIDADSSKQHEDASKSQTALIAAAIMGAAQPKKEDPWDVVKRNLEKRIEHK